MTIIIFITIINNTAYKKNPHSSGLMEIRMTVRFESAAECGDALAAACPIQMAL